MEPGLSYCGKEKAGEQRACYYTLLPQQTNIGGGSQNQSLSLPGIVWI